jgi:peptide/nickel transport system substrate-binding protein
MIRARQRWAGAAGAVCLIALAACGRDEAGREPAGPLGLWAARAGEREEPVTGDSLVRASIGDISALIPNLTGDSASHAIGNLIYDGLVRFDKNLRMAGELAERWEASPDCRTFTFFLRRGVRWHDGVEFTAADVQFTYEVMRDPRTPTPYGETFRQVQSAEVLDRYTYRVHYAQPFAPALGRWGTWILPKHILEEPYRARQDLRTTIQNREPVGLGRFRFRQWKAGEKVVVVANRDHYAGRPRLDRIIDRVIPDQQTIFLELKARNADLAALTPMQFRRQSEYPAFRKQFAKYRHLANGYTYLGFNLRDPRFQDRRVRHAIAHAIDKREIIEGVLLGLGREAVVPYKPGTWVYRDDVARFPYDPAQARALLAEAGWRPGPDGILARNGEPFRFTLRTNQGNLVRLQTAEIIQRRLKEVGIDVRLHVVEWTAFLNTFIRKRDFEAIILAWGLGIDPDQYDIWHSSKTRPEELNHASYANPEVDRLLEAGRRTCDEASRKAIYGELQARLAEDQPIVFLFVPEALNAVAARIQGVEPAPAGLLHNLHEWYVPRDLQRYTR